MLLPQLPTCTCSFARNWRQSINQTLPFSAIFRRCKMLPSNHPFWKIATPLAGVFTVWLCFLLFNNFMDKRDILYLATLLLSLGGVEWIRSKAPPPGGGGEAPAD